jgi:hypothetical protein
MTRKKIDQARIDAVSTRLRQMFQAVESMPIPDRLMSVIDQLDEGEAGPAPTARRSATRRATSG